MRPKGKCFIRETIVVVYVVANGLDELLRPVVARRVSAGGFLVGGRRGGARERRRRLGRKTTTTFVGRESFDDDGRDDEIRKTLHDTRRVGNERDIWLSRSCFRRVIGGPVDVFNRYDVRRENRRKRVNRAWAKRGYIPSHLSTVFVLVDYDDWDGRETSRKIQQRERRRGV